MSTKPPSSCVHATTIAIDGHGVMFTGPSGAGKSDLALRLIDRGALLVSDDYTDLVRAGDAVIAAPPSTIAGKIEVRGLGIVERAFAASIPVELVVTLGDETDRMPEARWRMIAGLRIREVVIDPCHPSAPIKVEEALRQIIAEGNA